MLSLADVLELPVVRRALPEVLVGDADLGRESRWAHVIEMPDPDDLLKGGELVLTTGLGAREDPAAWTASLVEQGVGALGGAVGSSWRGVASAGGRGAGGAPVRGGRPRALSASPRCRARGARSPLGRPGGPATGGGRGGR